MTTHLFSLPSELLIQIICLLPRSDIYAFQLTNKFLCNIIRSSVDVQYHIALTSSCSEDNLYSSLPISEKLSVLREREKAWSLIKPRFTKVINAPDHAWRYQLLAGVIFLGDFERNTVHFLRLPSDESDEPQWEKIMTVSSIVEFCPVVEYDLIAIMTTTPKTQEDGQIVYRIEIGLHQLSSGKPHPQAREHNISVMDSLSEKPVVYIRIVGENLAPIFSFDGEQEKNDQIFVFKWRSGELKEKWLAEHGSSATCLFLSENLLLIPNQHNNSLDIFRIPERPGSLPPTPIVVLDLPTLAVGYRYRYIFPRTKPDPFTSPAYFTFREDEGSNRLLSKRSFFPKEEETISVFQLVVDHIWRRRTILTFVMQTRAILNLVEMHYAHDQRDPKESAPVILPYAIWGPSATRWFSSSDYANTWVASSWGQRYVQLKHNFDGNGVPIIVMDFNPRSVQDWQRRNGRGGNEEGNPHRKWCVSSLDVVEPFEIFAEDVHGGLPYVATATETLYTFHGLMMDDERILGVKDKFSGGIDSIEVLYLG
ncbi:hypothetical protein CPB84DRAFT_1785468 [Gymnopilus junonius]|uniref:F-box domain-containing protein n=1 Tax=Gymnopilus junonius TaxID=109634 RepID=A0A9P5TLI1_GYMJU|nr:hypothetical protein CPB84DRAFT_1785468 [Gymnopilus junonius]